MEFILSTKHLMYILFYKNHKKSKLSTKWGFSLGTLICIFLLSSCYSSKNASYYFKNIHKDTVVQATINQFIEPKVKPNDIISVKISSANPVEDAIFNATQSLSVGTSNGYLVDIDGNIELHKLGKTKVSGLTMKEISEKLKKDFTPYLKDPIVVANFLNTRVSVIGEVSKSQTVELPKDEKISILELIALSGDLTENADRKNVMIIRETDTGRQFKQLNLEDNSIFTSSWYYLKANDVVYFMPNPRKLLQNTNRQKNQQLLTTILSGTSLFFLILDRIVR